MNSLFELGWRCHEISTSHGFWENDGSPEPTKKAEKLCLVHSELSECLEAVRKPTQDKYCPQHSNEIVELADALIRILDYCYHYNLPIDLAVQDKMLFNSTRPYKHGKKI